MARPCIDCGGIAAGTRCEECRLARGKQRERTRQRPTARQRGYTTQYERNREAVLSRPGGDVCWICQHPGADQADHLTPTSEGGDGSMTNLAPAHGTAPCPTCGRRCNQARGSRTVTTHGE